MNVNKDNDMQDYVSAFNNLKERPTLRGEIIEGLHAKQPKLWSNKKKFSMRTFIISVSVAAAVCAIIIAGIIGSPKFNSMIPRNRPVFPSEKAILNTENPDEGITSSGDNGNSSNEVNKANTANGDISGGNTPGNSSAGVNNAGGNASDNSNLRNSTDPKVITSPAGDTAGGSTGESGSSGDLLFEKGFGGNGFNTFNATAKTDDGIIAVGYSRKNVFGTGDWTDFSAEAGTATMVKFDNNGNLMWKNNFGNLLKDNSGAEPFDEFQFDEFQDVTVINDNIVAAGYFIKNTVENSAIVMCDKDGNVIWQSIYDSGQFTGLAAVNDGIIAVGLQAGSPIIVKYNFEGDILWKKKFR